MTTQQDVKEVQLSGEKLAESTNDLSLILSFGQKLYEANRDFVRGSIPDNWFAVIDPRTGKLIAADSQIKLYTYTQDHYPDIVFYFVGLLKNRLMQVL